MSGCPMHGTWGDYCGPECKRLDRELRRSHVCEDHAEEVGHDGPRPNGTEEIITRCGVCRRNLSHGTIRVLWAY